MYKQEEDKTVLACSRGAVRMKIPWQALLYYQLPQVIFSWCSSVAIFLSGFKAPADGTNPVLLEAVYSMYDLYVV